MGLKAKIFLAGVGFLAACETIPQGASAVGPDGFFATNIGRRVGQAEALAASCPSISVNAATIQQYRTAICEGLDGEEGCSLPTYDSERQRLFNLTSASLVPLSTEQACAFTRAEAGGDETLNSFLLGVAVAPVVVARPAVHAPVEVEPEAPISDEGATI